MSNSKKQTHARDTERKEPSELLTKGIEVDQKNPKDISLGAWLNYGVNYKQREFRKNGNIHKQYAFSFEHGDLELSSGQASRSIQPK